jgi:hypothetical protein
MEKFTVQHHVAAMQQVYDMITGQVQAAVPVEAN